MSDDHDETPLIPARMLNEFVYCPRLAVLEWVDGEFAHSGEPSKPRRRAARALRERVSKALARRGIEHAVIGAAALAAHGVAGTTIDIDLLTGRSRVPGRADLRGTSVER